jgi:hypothetical protein
MSGKFNRVACLALAAALLALGTGSAQAQLFGDHWKRPWWGDEERMDRPTAGGGVMTTNRLAGAEYRAYLFGPHCWHETREVRVRGGWAPRVVRVCR